MVSWIVGKISKFLCTLIVALIEYWETTVFCSEDSLMKNSQYNFTLSDQKI
jgi:hypothetical protein